MTSVITKEVFISFERFSHEFLISARDNEVRWMTPEDLRRSVRNSKPTPKVQANIEQNKRNQNK